MGGPEERKVKPSTRNIIHSKDGTRVYRIPFIISLSLLVFITFYTPRAGSILSDSMVIDSIEMIDLDTIQAPKRMVTKEISIDRGDISEDTDVDKARGDSDLENAVDLAFYTDVIAPRPQGRLPKYYPKLARELGVEAVVNVELVVLANGLVKQVRIIHILLAKELSPELKKNITNLFSHDARRILMGAMFTAPVVQGRNVPVRMNMPLRFKLD